MIKTYPGTTIEVSKLEKNSSQILFDGIFATGGITLSQLAVMTGLEPYLIQNWVKRGFVSSPQKRLYNREQLAGIIIINMLRTTLQIDRICNLMHAIMGEKPTLDDDLIGTEALYHRYVNMIAEGEVNPTDLTSVQRAAARAAEDFKEPFPGAKKRLVTILQVMLCAHASASLHHSAEEILASLS